MPGSAVPGSARIPSVSPDLRADPSFDDARVVSRLEAYAVGSSNPAAMFTVIRDLLAGRLAPQGVEAARRLAHLLAEYERYADVLRTNPGARDFARIANITTALRATEGTLIQIASGFSTADSVAWLSPPVGSQSSAFPVGSAFGRGGAGADQDRRDELGFVSAPAGHDDATTTATRRLETHVGEPIGTDPVRLLVDNALGRATPPRWGDVRDDPAGATGHGFGDPLGVYSPLPPQPRPLPPAAVDDPFVSADVAASSAPAVSGGEGRLILPTIGDVIDYRRWRFTVTALLAEHVSSVPREILLAWVSSVSSGDRADLLRPSRVPSLARLDVLLFSALVRSIQKSSGQLALLCSAALEQCPTGAGRLALAAVDALFGHEARRQLEHASAALHAMPGQLRMMGDLEVFLMRFQTHLRLLADMQQPLPPHQVRELLLRLVKPVGEAQKVVASWKVLWADEEKAKTDPTDSRKVFHLFQLLRSAALDYRLADPGATTHETTQKALTAGLPERKGGKDKRKRKGKGNDRDQKDQADSTNQPGAKKGGKKGKAKGEGKAKSGKGPASDTTTCSHCRRSGHTADNCWANPESSQYRGWSVLGQGLRATRATTDHDSGTHAVVSTVGPSASRAGRSAAPSSAASEDILARSLGQLLLARISPETNRATAVVVRAAGARQQVPSGRSPSAAPREWVIDCGASRNVVGQAPAGSTTTLDTPFEVMTAKGPVTVCNGAFVGSPLGPVFAIIIPGSPSLLALSELIACGYRFEWGISGPQLFSPTGELIPLRLDNGVPILSSRRCSPTKVDLALLTTVVDEIANDVRPSLPSRGSVSSSVSASSGASRPDAAGASRPDAASASRPHAVSASRSSAGASRPGVFRDASLTFEKKSEECPAELPTLSESAPLPATSAGSGFGFRQGQPNKQHGPPKNRVTEEAKARKGEPARKRNVLILARGSVGTQERVTAAGARNGAPEKREEATCVGKNGLEKHRPCSPRPCPDDSATVPRDAEVDCSGRGPGLHGGVGSRRAFPTRSGRAACSIATAHAAFTQLLSLLSVVCCGEVAETALPYSALPGGDGAYSSLSQPSGESLLWFRRVVWRLWWSGGGE